MQQLPLRYFGDLAQMAKGADADCKVDQNGGIHKGPVLYKKRSQVNNIQNQEQSNYRDRAEQDERFQRALISYRNIALRPSEYEPIPNITFDHFQNPSASLLLSHITDERRRLRKNR